jgi:hypothetical protein
VGGEGYMLPKAMPLAPYCSLHGAVPVASFVGRSVRFVGDVVCCFKDRSYPHNNNHSLYLMVASTTFY